MATANQLIASGGSYMAALLPTIKQLAANRDPFQANAAAQILGDYMNSFGAKGIYNKQPNQ